MFRCTDCGQEYKIKPDYCDCGNNIFEEILPAAPKKSPEPVSVKEQVTRSQVVRKSVDLYAVLIFVACIILSILSLIFIGRGGKSPANTEPAATPAPKVEIPSIDKLWKDSALKAPEPATLAPIVAPQPQPIIKVSTPTAKPVQKAQAPKKTQTPSQAPALNAPAKTQPAATLAQTQAASQKTPSMTEAQKEEIIKKLTKSNNQKTQTTPPTSQKPAQTATTPAHTQPAQTASQPAQPVQQVEVKQLEPPKIDYAAQKRELNAYKVALRNKIGGSINFSAVIGDGKCAVTFKLDGTGNLINRAFSVQSTNDSLNDAVFAAMMQNPTFQAPPEGYKNETLTLSVKIYGGQFEVDLK